MSGIHEAGAIAVANAPVSYGAFELTVGHDPDVPGGVTVPGPGGRGRIRGNRPRAGRLPGER